MKPYYETDLGKLYHGDFLKIMPELEPVDLVVADPPYFKIKGEFDFKWKYFNEYLKDVALWAKALKKILSEKGTLFWFGDEKNIAYSQIIFDKYFGLLNNLVWYKYNLRGGMFGSSGGDNVRSFPICTERILMYSNDVYNLTQCVFRVRDYIRGEIIRAKGEIVLKDINMAMNTAISGGGVASACLSLDKTEPTMLTKEMYKKLQEWLNGVQKYEYLRQEYEYLRQEYEDLRRPFSNTLRLTEILQFNSDTNNNLNHDTVKPLSLIRALILTCSRKNDMILDPFLGTGTSAIICEELTRRWIGIEIEEKYCEISAKRIESERAQIKMF